MNTLLTIGAAAKARGVSTSTFRRWERIGRLTLFRAGGDQRCHNLSTLRPGLHHGAMVACRTVTYARVSKHGQTAYLLRQERVLELYCASEEWAFDAISDLDSRTNYHKKELKRLLDETVFCARRVPPASLTTALAEWQRQYAAHKAAGASARRAPGALSRMRHKPRPRPPVEGEALALRAKRRVQPPPAKQESNGEVNEG